MERLTSELEDLLAAARAEGRREAERARLDQLTREIQANPPILVTPRPLRDIRYGATSLRPERAPLGAYLALIGAALVFLGSTQMSLIRADVRILTVVAVLAAVLGALSWLRKRGFGFAYAVLGPTAVGLWLVELSARAQLADGANQLVTAARVAPLGSWLLLVGGLLISFAAMAGLPWHPVAKRPRKVYPLSSPLDWVSGPLSMRVNSMRG